MTTSAEAPQQSQGTETPIKTQFALDKVLRAKNQRTKKLHGSSEAADTELNNFYMNLLEENWQQLSAAFLTKEPSAEPQVPEEWEILFMENALKKTIEIMLIYYTNWVEPEDNSDEARDKQWDKWWSSQPKVEKIEGERTNMDMDEMCSPAIQLGWLYICRDYERDEVALTEEGFEICQQYEAIIRLRDAREAEHFAEAQGIRAKIRQGMAAAGLLQNTQNAHELTSEDEPAVTAD